MTNQQLFNWVADADELLARLAGVDAPECRVLQQRVEAGIAYAKDAIKAASGQRTARPVGLMITVGIALALAAVIAAERWRR